TLHHRQGRPRRRQGRRHGRGGGPDDVPGPPARHPDPDGPGRHRPPLRPLPERLRPARRRRRAGELNMDNPFEGKEIWFLTGSQDLYGEDTLAQVAEQSAQIVATLNEAEQIPVRIVLKGTMKDRDTIRDTARAANADPRCLGVVVWMHTFSPAKMWILGLDALDKPILHLHTQANLALPWSTIDMDFMNLNQAAHGDREFAYLATRMGVARKTVVGHASHEPVRDKIATWARAAAGWDALQHMRVAR